MSNLAIFEKLKQQRIEQARQSLMPFVLYTKQDYESGWFNELLCAEMDQFLLDVAAGKSPRLMIFAPPRSGKSEIASRRFPAYALGRFPNWNIIACSYSSDLANRMSRDTQRVIDQPEYHDIFPGTNLNLSNVKTVSKGAIRTVELWETVDADGNLGGGSYRAAGVNGGITGQGMNIGIIDDPAKDYKTAASAAYQEAVMDWYDTTFFTRRDPKLNGIVIILTRWHQLDLAGQLLARAEKGGEQWRVVSFPMEAEKTEFHELNGQRLKLREPGDILFPERMPREFVEACKRSGSLSWNALYQQRPTTKGGGVIKSDWFGYYRVLPRIKWRAIYADTAQKTANHNDYSVFQLWGMGEDGNAYMLDQIRGKWEAWELEIKAAAFYQKHKAYDPKHPSPIRYMAIEDKASGTGLIQNIRKKAGAPVKAIPRGTDKVTRVLDVQGFIESGYVRLPDPSASHSHTNAEWVSDFIMEAEAFSLEMSHAHDDQIDPMCDAISDMLGGTKSTGFDWL